MKNLDEQTGFSIFSRLLLAVVLVAGVAISGWGQETWINENIQDWTASPYAEDSQETIDVGETTGTVDIIKSWVRPTTTEYDNTGFVQMRNSPMSFLILPEIPDVGQVEFNLSAFGANRSLQLQKHDGEDWVLVHTFTGIGEFLGNFTYDIDQDASITLRLTSPSAALRVHDIIIYKFDDEPPTQVATPSFNPGTGNFYAHFDVEITTTTEDATIKYSFDSDDPETGTWVEYDDEDRPTISETTTIWAYAEKAGMDDSNVASAIYTFPIEVASIEALQDIAEIGGLYRITGEVFMTYQNDSRNQKYFQDELDGGRGLKIDDPNGNLTTVLNIGDGVTNLTGTIGQFNRMIQFTPVQNQSPALPNSTGNTLTPLPVTLEEIIDENNIITVAEQEISVFQALLIEIEDLQFEQAGDFDSETSFGELPISDPTASLVDIDAADFGVLFRVEYADLEYNGDPIPQVPLTLTAIVDQRFSNARIFARDWDDFDIPDPLLFVSPATISNLDYIVDDGPSDPQSFELTGINLDGTDVTVTAPADFEISEDGTKTFGPTITLSAYDGTAQTIWVRLEAGLPLDEYDGNITIGGGGADDVQVAVSGEVTEPLLTEVPFETKFGTDENWDLITAANSYGEKAYEEGGWYIFGENAFRGETYPFEDSDYAFRERVLFTITNLAPAEGMTGFSLQLFDWMLGAGGNRDLDISFDGGDSWETLLTVNKDWFNEYQVYQEFIHYFDEAKDFGAEEFIISIGDGAANNNNRINIGQFKALDEEPPLPPAVPDPVFDLAASIFFEDITVFIQNFDDYEATTNIYFTLDGEDPTGEDALYDDEEGIFIEDGNGPVTLKAIAIDGEEESDITSAVYTFPLNVDDIEQLRQQTLGDLYRVDNPSVFIGGTTFRNTKFFQDDSGFGIQIDDPGDHPIIITEYVIGDQVAELIAVLTQFQGQLQLSARQDPAFPIDTNVEVEPLERTLDELTQDDQSRLVVVYNVIFEDGDGIETFGGGGSTTSITDASIDGFVGLYRNVFGDSDITGSTIPEGPVNITGIIQENDAGLNLAARNLDDFAQDDGTVIVNGTQYATLQHAVDAASPGDKIKFEGEFEDLDASGSWVILSPGTSPGCATFTGTFTLDSTENLEIIINGYDLCDGFSQVHVGTVLTLGGADLDIDLRFAPDIGETFIIMTFDTIDGEFAQGAEITADYDGQIFTFSIEYGDGVVTLEVTNILDPSAIPIAPWAIFLPAIMMLAFVVRRLRKKTA